MERGPSFVKQQVGDKLCGAVTGSGLFTFRLCFDQWKQSFMWKGSLSGNQINGHRKWELTKANTIKCISDDIPQRNFSSFQSASVRTCCLELRQFHQTINAVEANKDRSFSRHNLVNAKLSKTVSSLLHLTIELPFSYDDSGLVIHRRSCKKPKGDSMDTHPRKLQHLLEVPFIFFAKPSCNWAKLSASFLTVIFVIPNVVAKPSVFPFSPWHKLFQFFHWQRSQYLVGYHVCKLPKITKSKEEMTDNCSAGQWSTNSLSSHVLSIDLYFVQQETRPSVSLVPGNVNWCVNLSAKISSKMIKEFFPHKTN